jgi:hypothetical protein
MVAADRRAALDHVVVVMFENRSFDNLLGRLYQPGEVEAFEGVGGKELSNPLPGWAEHGADRKVVPYGISPTMNTPWPDPGEEFPHPAVRGPGRGQPRDPPAGDDLQHPAGPGPAAHHGRVPHRLHQHVPRRVRPPTHL